jgi:hypothetical protein
MKANKTFKHNDIIFKEQTNFMTKEEVMVLVAKHATLSDRFPILWEGARHEQLISSYMYRMKTDLKQSLVKDNKMGCSDTLYLYYEMIFRLVAFIHKGKYHYIRDGDEIKRLYNGNSKFAFEGDYFVIRAIQDIKKGEDISLQTETDNYRSFMAYGEVVPNRKKDCTFSVVELPVGWRKNINWEIFQGTAFEFELMGEYKCSTVEVFSALRYFAQEDADKKKCPSRITGYDMKPISKENELKVIQVLRNSLVTHRSHFTASKSLVKDPIIKRFLKSETDVIDHWLNELAGAEKILSSKTPKKEFKKFCKTDQSVYLHLIQGLL